MVLSLSSRPQALKPITSLDFCGQDDSTKHGPAAPDRVLTAALSGLYREGTV